MKTPSLLFAGFVVAASAGPLVAGDLTIPNNFTANTTAVASEVNANFDAVETAVDDNDARITSNTSDISTNTSNIAINTSDISAMDTQVTELSTGYVSIHAAAFVLEDTNVSVSCNRHLSINYASFTDGLSCGTPNGAVLYASLNLPHGLVVTGFGCGIYDNSTDGYIDRITFYRQPINTGAYIGLSDLTTDSTNMSAIQILSSGVLSHTVDNMNAGYGIRIIFGNSGSDFSTIGSSLRLIGCSVAYQP